MGSHLADVVAHLDYSTKVSKAGMVGWICMEEEEKRKGKCSNNGLFRQGGGWKYHINHKGHDCFIFFSKNATKIQVSDACYRLITGIST